MRGLCFCRERCGQSASQSLSFGQSVVIHAQVSFDSFVPAGCAVGRNEDSLRTKWTRRRGERMDACVPRTSSSGIDHGGGGQTEFPLRCFCPFSVPAFGTHSSTLLILSIRQSLFFLGHFRPHPFLLFQPRPLRPQQRPLLSGVRRGQGCGRGGSSGGTEGQGLAEPWMALNHGDRFTKVDVDSSL